MSNIVFSSTHRLGRILAVLVALALSVASSITSASDVLVQFANLHNPYFTDRSPSESVGKAGKYQIAPPLSRYFGIEGDSVPVPFTVVSSIAQNAKITAKLLSGNNVIGETGEGSKDLLLLFRARDVNVEGNSNASCSCPAGEVPQSAAAGGMECIKESAAAEDRIPKSCPTDEQRAKIAGTFVRAAPFAIKDPLEPVSSEGTVKLVKGTELFVVHVQIAAALPKGNLELQVLVAPVSGGTETITVPLRVLPLKLERFPELDLSYWLSEDPRDLVARPSGTALTASWGGKWWSEDHWKNIEHAAKLQASLAVTNTLVPLFVRNPFGIGSKPLVPVRCITGSDTKPNDFRSTARNDQLSPFNEEVLKWHYEFEFDNFARWVSIFKKEGFRRFEGAHLFANAGELPSELVCDLYMKKDDSAPYARAFGFLPRQGNLSEDPAQKVVRASIYKEKFLPTFLQQLARELKKLKIEKEYLQHVIDENSSSDAAIDAYASAVAIIRENSPAVRTMDAINQYTAPRYKSLIDVPVLHLLLVYSDQSNRQSIRKEVDNAFLERKYFYNTALRAGGPNRHLDTNALESRAYGWLGIETGYNGILYWASNRYRYPNRPSANVKKRPDDWSPYLYSLGPLPNGRPGPAHGAGGNWILYPTPSGLIGSLRALRLRDGLLDHWIYMQAWSKCSASADKNCLDQLADIRKQLSGDTSAIADFSHNPAEYDQARERMLRMLEQ